MTAVIRGVGTAANSTTTATPGLPSGTAVGDLLLMFCEGEFDGVPGASGWTNGPNNQNSNGTIVTMLWRIATGTDPTTTTDPGNHIVCQIVGIQAGTYKASNPFDTFTTSNDGATATTSVSLPGVTTNGPDRLILQAMAVSVITTVSGWTNANLSSINEVVDVSTNDGLDGSIAVVSGVMAAAGATGATTATLSSGGFRAYITVAINPSDDASKEPLIRGIGVADSDGVSTTLTPGMPTLTIPGDLLLCWCAAEGLLASSASGWTKYTTVNHASGGVYMVLFYKVAAGGDSISLVYTANNAVARVVGIQAGSYDSADPIPTSSNGSATGSSSLSIPGLTTTSSRSLVFPAVGLTVSGSASGWTNASLSGLAEVFDNNTALNGASSLAVAAGIQATAGTTNTTTGSCTSSDQVYLTVAVKANPQVLTLGTVASGEAVPNPIVMTGLVLGTVATAESVPNPTLMTGLVLPTIATAESVYAPNVVLNLLPGTIATAEQFYNPSLLGITYVDFDATASTETVYAPQLDLELLLDTIASGESVPNPLITLHLLPSTIATEEAVYAPELGLIIYPGELFDEVVYEPFFTIYMTLGTATSNEFVYSPSVGVVYVGFGFGGATRDARVKQLGTIGSSRGLFGFGPTSRRFS